MPLQNGPHCCPSSNPPKKCQCPAYFNRKEMRSQLWRHGIDRIHQLISPACFSSSSCIWLNLITHFCWILWMPFLCPLWLSHFCSFCCYDNATSALDFLQYVDWLVVGEFGPIDGVNACSKAKEACHNLLDLESAFWTARSSDFLQYTSCNDAGPFPIHV